MQTLHHESISCNGRCFEIEQTIDDECLKFISKDLINKTSQMIRFLVELLGIDTDECKFRSLKIRIEMSGDANLDGYFEDKGEYGLVVVYCQQNQSERELLETIAHELVHAYQWGYKRLHRTYKQGVDGCFHGCNVWEKTHYDDPESDEQYHNLPWEKEAFALQEMLVDLFHVMQD